MKDGGSLEAKLADANVAFAIFVFKSAAEALLGPLAGDGFVGRRLGRAEVFVMPGPYEKRERAELVLETLRRRVEAHETDGLGS